MSYNPNKTDDQISQLQIQNLYAMFCALYLVYKRE